MTALANASAIAGILQRALAAVATEEAFVVGVEVTRVTPATDRLRGRVAFVDDGVVYWAGDDGFVHASAPSALEQ